MTCRGESNVDHGVDAEQRRPPPPGRARPGAGLGLFPPRPGLDPRSRTGRRKRPAANRPKQAGRRDGDQFQDDRLPLRMSRTWKAPSGCRDRGARGAARTRTQGAISSTTWLKATSMAWNQAGVDESTTRGVGVAASRSWKTMHVRSRQHASPRSLMSPPRTSRGRSASEEQDHDRRRRVLAGRIEPAQGARKTARSRLQEQDLPAVAVRTSGRVDVRHVEIHSAPKRDVREAQQTHNEKRADVAADTERRVGRIEQEQRGEAQEVSRPRPWLAATPSRTSRPGSSPVRAQRGSIVTTRQRRRHRRGRAGAGTRGGVSQYDASGFASSMERIVAAASGKGRHDQGWTRGRVSHPPSAAVAARTASTTRRRLPDGPREDRHQESARQRIEAARYIKGILDREASLRRCRVGAGRASLIARLRAAARRRRSC